MTSALHFLINTVFSILTLVFLLRFLMQMLRASFNNPIGQIVIALTDFAVKPARRFIPGWKKLDLSTLVLAFLVQLILQLILLSLSQIQVLTNTPVLAIAFFRATLGVASTLFDIFFYAILLQVILSWVNPHTPFAPVLHSITQPILGPIQRIVPTISGIDFSPLVAIILLQMLNIAIFSAL